MSTTVARTCTPPSCTKIATTSSPPTPLNTRDTSHTFKFADLLPIVVTASISCTTNCFRTCAHLQSVRYYVNSNKAAQTYDDWLFKSKIGSHNTVGRKSLVAALRRISNQVDLTTASKTHLLLPPRTRHSNTGHTWGCRTDQRLSG